MDVGLEILDAYAHLEEIECAVTERRFSQAVNQATELLERLAHQEDAAKTNVQYYLLKESFESLRDSASALRTAAEKISYGAGLIDKDPFAAVIHLGSASLTRNAPEFEGLRDRLQKEAYETWISDVHAAKDTASFI